MTEHSVNGTERKNYDILKQYHHEVKHSTLFQTV